MSEDLTSPEPAVEPAPASAEPTPETAAAESRPRDARPMTPDFVRSVAEKTARLVAKDVARDIARQAARDAIRDAIGSGGGGGGGGGREDVRRGSGPVKSGELLSLLRAAIAEAMRRDRDWEEELADAIGATPDDLKGFLAGDEPDAETTLMLVQELARWQSENETEEEEDTFSEASDSDDAPEAESAEASEEAGEPAEEPAEAPADGDDITPPEDGDEDSRPVPIPVD